MCLFYFTDSSIIDAWLVKGRVEKILLWYLLILKIYKAKYVGIKAFDSFSVIEAPKKKTIEILKRMRALLFRKCNIFYISFCQICRIGLNQMFQKCLFIILNSSILLRKLWITYNTSKIKRNVMPTAEQINISKGEQTKKAILWFGKW